MRRVFISIWCILFCLAPIIGLYGIFTENNYLIVLNLVCIGLLFIFAYVNKRSHKVKNFKK